MPEQVLCNREAKHFAGIHFLALVSDAATVQARIERRLGAASAIKNLARHLAVNADLQAARMSPPHTLAYLDTTALTPEMTIEAATAWVGKFLTPG